MSPFYKANKELVDRQYRIFKSKVNMTYAEMVEWKKNKCSRAASLDPLKVINRVTRLLKKPKITWTKKDYEDSKMVISYNSRSVKITESSIPAKPKWGCFRGKNFYAGKNWARDDDKNRKKKRRRNPTSKNIDASYLQLLKQAIRDGSRYDLVNAIIYANQGEICDDCNKEFRNCECELCDDCKYRRCLCHLDIPARWETVYDEHKKLISEEGLKLAKQTLDRDNFRKLKSMLYKPKERIY